MAGGKGKSTGGKAGTKEAAGKAPKSHSAKAGLQVRDNCSRQRFLGVHFIRRERTSDTSRR